MTLGEFLEITKNRSHDFELVDVNGLCLETAVVGEGEITLTFEAGDGCGE